MNYYPLIRGRQADLQALTACLPMLSGRVRPVLEPVKDIAALPRTVTAFTEANHPLFVVTNPSVGQYGLLANPRYPLPPVTVARHFDPYPAALSIVTTPAQVRLLAAKQLALLPNTAVMRRLRYPQAIYLEDHYPTREHTVDYYRIQDEFYQYPQTTLPGIGLADYPLSTSHYSDKGYPQRAIALHILYPHKQMLRLHHFVSVNNDDFRDPGRKFFEALAPLPDWLRAHPEAETPALATLLASDHFPGLGVIRKLQLMHWLTIVDRWLAPSK